MYGEKAFTSNTQRALRTSPCSSCCSEYIVDDWKLSFHLHRPVFVHVTWNLNLYDFIFQVLRLIGVKACILKPQTFVLWTPHKEHTESAICKDHLAPCRFKCWTNQISIGISQPLAQVQCLYNVEIPRVSLANVGLKWDFRTDRHSTNLKARYKRFINCCLAGPLPVPASAWHHDCQWALALACWGMQLLRVSFALLSVVTA